MSFRFASVVGCAGALVSSSAWAQAPSAAPAAEAAPVAEAAPAATDPTVTATPTPSAPPPAVAAAGEAAAAGLPESADDSFVTDPSANPFVGEDGPKLEFYGFADFSYLHILGNKTNILKQYVAPYPRFYVGHLNLYMASTLGENWRSLAEVRFTYSPVGDDDKQASDGSFPVPDTNAVDYAELQRTFSWGGIEVQRAWLEYQPFDFLSIRGGQWLTPYGYWNDDHGSPTIIAVHKPFPIGDAFFPEHQTGLVAHGKYFVGSTAAIGYAATLSNGRGPYDVIKDLDNNKAVGGRLYLESQVFGNLTVGVDAYRGRFTASTKRYRVDTSGPDPVAVIYRTTDIAYDELSLGADVRWIYKDLHVQGEVMTNEARYDERYRPRTVGFDPKPTFAADYRRVGGYLLIAYRTPFFNLMPYVTGEHSSYTNTDLAPPAWAWSAGVNLRPTPTSF